MHSNIFQTGPVTAIKTSLWVICLQRKSNTYFPPFIHCPQWDVFIDLENEKTHDHITSTRLQINCTIIMILYFSNV